MSVDVNATDSYIRYVRLRMATINPLRVIKGPMDAQDWPTKDIVFGSLYLLTLADTPIGAQGYSPSVPIYTIGIQWSWAILGSDLKSGTRGRNRGDRYREDASIKADLLKAVYPNYTEKLQLSMQNGQLVATSFDPPESIFWTPLEFRKTPDRDSGLIYGVATSYISTMTEKIST